MKIKNNVLVGIKDSDIVNGKVTVPNGVISIGHQVFRDRTDLFCVDLPDSLTHIDDYAFAGCTKLGSIKFPPNVSFIGKYVFYRCSRLKILTLPENLTHMGEDAFRMCKGLKEVRLPKSLPVIPDRAFMGCCRIEEMEMHEGLESIGTRAFEHSNLGVLEFPKTITHIGDRAFTWNRFLTDVTFLGETEYIGPGAFSHCTRITSVHLPKKLKVIRSQMFFECERLVNLKFPEDLLSIESNAFRECKNLMRVEFPQTLNHIGACAFADCLGLESVKFPNKLKSIGEGAFWNCTNLGAIRIPASVLTIGNNAFEGCINLPELSFVRKNKGYDTFTLLQAGDVTLFVSSRCAYANGINVYEGRAFRGMSEGSLVLEDLCVVGRSNVYGNGKTLLLALADLRANTPDGLDPELYQYIPVDKPLPLVDMLAMYRIVTEASSAEMEEMAGVLDKKRKNYTVREVASLTCGLFSGHLFACIFGLETKKVSA